MSRNCPTRWNHFCPVLTQLEGREVPAVFAVGILSPAVGDIGESAATFIGGITLDPTLPTQAGKSVVTATDPTAAIQTALVNTVTATVGNQSANYAPDAQTIGTTTTAHLPFVVTTTATAGQYVLHLEDLSLMPGSTPDWDYNDRTWTVTVTEISTANVSFTGSYTLLDNSNGITENSIGVTVSVTPISNYGAFRWSYTVTNFSSNSSASDDMYDLGMGRFALTLPDAAVVNLSPSPAGWSGQVTTNPDGSGTVEWAGGALMVGGSPIEFVFQTPPREVGSSPAEAKTPSPSSQWASVGPIATPARPSVVMLTLDDYIPVNANNDNGSAWVQGHDFIPVTRDFDAENLTVNDPQLKPLTINLSERKAGGTIDLTYISTNTGRVDFYNTQKKAARVNHIVVPAGQGAFTTTVYVEGDQMSGAVLNDTTVVARYTPTVWIGSPLDGYFVGSKAVTVTPIVFSWNWVSPNGVFFANGTSGKDGVFADFKGTIDAYHTGGVDGSISFINLVTAEIGGKHQFLNPNLNISYQIQGDNGYDLYEVAPLPGLEGEFPFLDAKKPTPGVPHDPLYPFVTVAASGTIPGAKMYTMSDAPGVAPVNPGGLANRSLIDREIHFLLHCVIQYSDKSIYSIGYSEWRVIMYAHTWDSTKGVTVIDPVSKVEALQFVFDDSGPVKTDPPVANGSFFNRLITPS